MKPWFVWQAKLHPTKEAYLQGVRSSEWGGFWA
jgi:hypothetical protein